MRLGSVFKVFNSGRRIRQLEEEVAKLKKASPKGYTSYLSPFLPVNYRPTRLSYSQLFKIYSRSSAVRASVDAITRQVTSIPFDFVPKPGCNVSQKRLDEVTEFFEDPNSNNETFRQLLTKVLTDVLVYDAGVIEKVLGPTGKLLEIYARDGSTFRPVVDEHGVLLKYKQEVAGKDPVEFNRDEIIYLMLYPSTNTCYGHPIIESIVDEVASLMFANQQIADSFTKDEIPPGILNLGQIGKEAYERAKQDFERKRGEASKLAIRVVYGTPKVEWVALKRPNREMQLDELRSSIERIIFRNFGLMPIEYGESHELNRSTAIFQLRVSETRLLIPILNMLSSYINKEILEFAGYPDVMIRFKRRIFEDEEGESRAAARYVTNGIKSINEVRAERGLTAIEGGDRRFMIIGGNVIFLEDLVGKRGILKVSGNGNVPVDWEKLRDLLEREDLSFSAREDSIRGG